MNPTQHAETAVVDRTRMAHRLALIAGLAVVVLTMLEGAEPVRPCGALAGGYIPILAFELARSVADLQAIFGTSEPCRTAMIVSMERSIRTDTLFYIPAYGTFMVLVFLGWRARAPRLSKTAVYVTLVAALFDYIENLCLMKLMPQLDPASLWFALLPWITGVKWLALGLAAALAGLILLRGSGGWVWRLPAALIYVAALAVSIAAMTLPDAFGMWMIRAIGASWLMYFIAAARGASKPSASLPS